MKCPLCSDKRKVDEWDNIVEHLIITKNNKGHIHVHGPIMNTPLMKELIMAAIDQANRAQPPIYSQPLPPPPNQFPSQPPVQAISEETAPKDVVVDEKRPTIPFQFDPKKEKPADE